MAAHNFVCSNHKPVQHRDGREPWCKGCGLTAKGYTPIDRFKPATEYVPRGIPLDA